MTENGKKTVKSKKGGWQMERRSHKRICLHMKARIIFDDETYEGYIENVSENGIGSFITSSLKSKEALVYSDIIELDVENPLDETIHLNCRVKWIKRGLFSGTVIGLGVEIIDRIAEYRNWLKKLLLIDEIEELDRQSILIYN